MAGQDRERWAKTVAAFEARRRRWAEFPEEIEKAG